MTAAAFTMPDTSQVANLMVERLNETSLKPDSPVICINRGRKVLKDMWDGNPVEIPPGHFRTEYGAAQHFQRRLIVMGTRNLEVGGYVSWISILGSDDGRVPVDKPEDCEPFTDEELQAFGEKIEAIDRSAFSNPADRDVRLLRTSRVAAASPSYGHRPVIDASTQGSDGAAAAAAEVFTPPPTSATREAEAEAASEAPQPRPMRKR